MGDTPIACPKSVFYVIFTDPDPPIIDPYMVSTKNRVDTIISAAREGMVILPEPSYQNTYS